MNNECHHDDREEDVGEYHDDNGDLQHEETAATLQFPLQKPIGQDPMNNSSPLVLTLAFMGRPQTIQMGSSLILTFYVEVMTTPPMSKS